MSSSINCRHASLIAFLESRDTQGRLPFDDRPSQDDGCGRQDGGRFGQGNNCAGGSGGGRRGPYSRLPDSIKLTPDGSKAEYTADQLRHESPFASTRKASKLTIDSPNQVMGIAKRIGIKDPSDIAVIGAAGSKQAEIKIAVSSLGGIMVRSFSPIDPDRPNLGAASVDVTIKPEGVVDYKYFSPNTVAFNSMADGSISPSVVSASVIALMAQSLEAAEKNGIKLAKTEAAGSGTGEINRTPDGSFQGYRLWPKFGFDGEADQDTSRRFVDQPNSGTLLSPEARERYIRTRSLNVQDIIATKSGEEWWAKNGHWVNLKLDFTDKKSPGYKRFQQMVAVGKRAAAKLERQGRSAHEYWQWVAVRAGVPTEAEARSFVARLELSAFCESRNCGTGSGGFQKGNTCAGGVAADVAKGAAKGAVNSALAALGTTWFPPLVPKAAAAGAAFGAVKGLYDNQMRPTRVMKAIKKSGMTEDSVASLVKDLGGSPRSSADVKNGSLKLTIKDKDGKKTFGIDVASDKIVITPSRESGKLTKGEMEKVKSLAQGNSKREVSVIVKSQSPSYVSQLSRMGFKVAANSAGVLAASVVAPFVPGLVGHVIGSTVEAIAKKRND